MIELLKNTPFVYLAVINIVAAIIVVYDKSISKLPRGSVRRVPEKTFVTLSAIGGGIGTLLAMFWIRHKTKSHDGLLLKIGFFAAVWIVLILLTAKKLYMM